MAYYKIKNITDRLGKRDSNKDSIVVLEYQTGFKPEKRNLGVGQEFIVQANKLPTQLHKLRMKNLILVTEISENDFKAVSKPVNDNITTVKEIKPVKKSTTTTTAAPKKVTPKSKKSSKEEEEKEE